LLDIDIDHSLEYNVASFLAFHSSFVRSLTQCLRILVVLVLQLRAQAGNPVASSSSTAKEPAESDSSPAVLLSAGVSVAVVADERGAAAGSTHLEEATATADNLTNNLIAGSSGNGADS
jgi:uncharacterized alpha-E superfamily protein